VLCLAALVSAAPWAISLNANLNANQNAYSGNWTGTETGLLSWAAGVDIGVESQLSSITNN
jgi:hypothetical protein